MTNREKIFLGVLIVTILCGIALFFAFIKPGVGNTNSELFNKLVKAKDETIQALKEKEDALKLVISEKDKNVVALEERYNSLQQNYQQSQLIYKQLDAQIKNIPIRIAAIADNDDSIRAEFRHL